MKRVLFVCVRNSCRSQMAEGFARKLGANVVEAHSAGSEPSGVVNPMSIAAMKDAGIDISAHWSKGFDELPSGEWDVIITMGCGDACPFLPAKLRLDWDLPDPRGLSQSEFNTIRDQIHQRVSDLIDSLKYQ